MDGSHHLHRACGCCGQSASAQASGPLALCADRGRGGERRPRRCGHGSVVHRPSTVWGFPSPDPGQLAPMPSTGGPQGAERANRMWTGCGRGCVRTLPPQGYPQVWNVAHVSAWGCPVGATSPFPLSRAGHALPTSVENPVDTPLWTVVAAGAMTSRPETSSM